MTAEVHFVQAGDAPALVGAGRGTLTCACGNVLIEGFQPEQFLLVGIQCGRCGAITTTACLPEGKPPPSGLSLVEPSTQPRIHPVQVPAGVALVGQSEMTRLATLFGPAKPPVAVYQISASLLDETEAAYERHAGRALPRVEADPSDAFAGLRDHSLAWSVRHLRARVKSESWSCQEAQPTSNAVAHVTGFLHFVATWSRHPLFPAMVATADDRGFSPHGLALFGAAHALAMMRNRIGFPEPTGYPARIEGFNLAAGPAEVVRVHMEVFDRFEFPFGRKWDPGSVRAAVLEVVAAAQGRINMRNPGLLLLSPGSALPGYDEVLIEAVKAAMQSLGRKNRGLMALTPIALRLQAMANPRSVRFGYLVHPVVNRHYGGETLMQKVGT